MRRLFIKEMVHYSGVVEGTFFRIEKANSWLACLANGLLAGLAVGLVTWTFEQGDFVLFACLGSSAASVVLAPIAKSNSLRSILLAYYKPCLTSLVTYPFHTARILPLWAQCCLAVGISVFIMRRLDALHPAAVGAALAFLILDRTLPHLLLMLLAILFLLIVVKILTYIYLEELQFRYFGKEFKREYYGKECTISLPKTDDEPKPAPRPRSDDSPKADPQPVANPTMATSTR